LSDSGLLIWGKTYYGSGDQRLYVASIDETPTGDFIMAGYGNFDGVGHGNYDLWVQKVTSNGEIIWKRIYGGPDSDGEWGDCAIQSTNDGGFILLGQTKSFGDGEYDLWILKLDSNGNSVWQKTYGGNGSDFARSIKQTSDGGYIVLGEYRTADRSSDFWILKLNSNGTINWQKSYGGNSSEFASDITPTSDGGFVLTGRTGSFGYYKHALWILKINNAGEVEWQKTYSYSTFEYYDYSNAIVETKDKNFIVIGNSSNKKSWILKINSDGNKLNAGNYSTLFSICETQDQGFVAVGFVDLDYLRKYYMVKMDKYMDIDGCNTTDTMNFNVDVPLNVIVSDTTIIAKETSVTPKIDPIQYFESYSNNLYPTCGVQ
ncbi:hypothetical protein ACFL9U_11185, partial [Thermodesulfobacteriota bacterium]